MKLLIEDDGGDDYTPCTDQAQTSLLNYETKTYRIEFKDDITFNNKNTYTVQLQFQVGIPAMRGYYRCKAPWATGWSDKQLFTARWANLRNRDDVLNGAPYHTRFAADYVTLFDNIKLCFKNMKLQTEAVNINEIYEMKEWSQDDWPTAGKPKMLTQTKWNPKNNSNFSGYRNQNLYRRLNPYIKIDDSNIKRYQEPPKQDIEKGEKVNLIKVRLTNPVTDTVYNNLNLNKIADNSLSSCYILSDWSVFENNIVDFNFQVYKTDLEDVYSLCEENVNISSEDGTLFCTCNVYINEIDRNFIYFKFEEPDSIVNLFPVEIVTVLDEEEFRYIGLNLQINTLNPYIDDSWIDTTNNVNIEYSYFNIIGTGNGYQISANPYLINLAANYKAILCAKKAAKLNLDHGYINTSGYSLPIFKNFKKDIEANKELTATINDGVVNTYYFLGTYNHVFDLTSAVSGFEYYITYNETVSGGKVAFSGLTIITLENSDTLYFLTSDKLSSNDFFELDLTYHFTTTLETELQITSANANQSIYNALCGYVGKVGGVINLNISTIADLSAVEYENFLTGITPIQIGADVKPLTGLPNT